MNNCATCKHWEPATRPYGEIPGVGTCTAVPQYWDASEWNDEGDNRILKDKYKNCLAFAKDGSDYRAEFRTFPEFGCVMHCAR